MGLCDAIEKGGFGPDFNYTARIKMVTRGSRDRERGKSVDLPAWWLELARNAAEHYGGSYKELGTALARAVGRRAAWHQSAIVRFFQERNATEEMAESFCVLLQVPRFRFVARNAAEAAALTATAARFAAS